MTATGLSVAAAHALGDFARLAATGEWHAALRAASDACHAAPDLAEAHYAYGEAWAALSEPVRAEQAFAAAIRLRPGWPDAWVNLGVARYRQGAMDDAKLAMRQALRHAPRHAAAANNLGVFLRLTGEAEQAEALLRAALAANPENAGARLNLAADLLQEERAQEALALLDAAPAPPAAAAWWHWRLQRSLALLHLNRFDEAREELAVPGQVPEPLAASWHWRHVLLAMGEGNGAGAIATAARMEAALRAPAMVPEHRIMGHYDLARFYSAIPDHARAFAHWQAGHDLLRRFQPFDRAAHRAVIDANIAHFNAARFTDGPRAANTDPAPVFIVGMPRSGTTLTERILAAHAMVHGAGERAALLHAHAALAGGADAVAIARLAARDAPALDAAAAAYLAVLHALAPDKARIVDKMPGNYLHLGLVGLMLPGARIIHCVRDPRDIGLSIFTFRFYGAHPYAHDLADLGWTIAEQSRLMAHWRAALPNLVITVALADWVDDFDGTLARVLAHLDLPPDPNCRQFHALTDRVRTVSRSQVREPVNARGLGRWRAYAEPLAPLLAELEAAGALAQWETQAARP